MCTLIAETPCGAFCTVCAIVSSLNFIAKHLFKSYLLIHGWFLSSSGFTGTSSVLLVPEVTLWKRATSRIYDLLIFHIFFITGWHLRRLLRLMFSWKLRQLPNRKRNQGTWRPQLSLHLETSNANQRFWLHRPLLMDLTYAIMPFFSKCLYVSQWKCLIF